VSLLALTESGLAAVHATRQHRRDQLNQLFEDWPEDKLSDFAELLERFNDSIERINPQ
jgi:DNA-binding MarR family transcriptional regulator